MADDSHPVAVHDPLAGVSARRAPALFTPAARGANFKPVFNTGVGLMNAHHGVSTWVLITIAVYFLPFFVAYARRHPQQLAITVLNIVAGWTLVGWVVALVWACID